MSASNIVLNDGQATPAAHTFIPLGLDFKTGQYWFADQASGAGLPENRISLYIKRPPTVAPGSNAGERNYRVQVGIHTPKLETLGTADNGLTPPDQIAYIPRVNVEFIMSERAVLQDRKDILAYVKNLMSEAQLIAMVQSLQSIT